MTGFAAAQGAAEGVRWSWEMRGVNGRGLDLRLRFPEGYGALETEARAAATKRLARGSVTIGLRLAQDGGATLAVPTEGQIDTALTAIAGIETQAQKRGLTLAPVRATDLFWLRFGEGSGEDAGKNERLNAALGASFRDLLDAFCAMRESEGKALKDVLEERLGRTKILVEQARSAAGERGAQVRRAIDAALQRITEATDTVDPERLSQELALIGIKSDVAEELDRLDTHIEAANELLGQSGPMGRKLDFLIQEFNREANTLCAKSQDKALTAIGLDLKLVVDQMREQAQNME
ncbi:MAG: YicC/YloC family endoribonuclease [Pseudomonadota bacterium]